MRDPFSRTMLDTRLPCRQSKTLYMGLTVVCRILQRDWPEAGGEDVDETQIFPVSTVTTVAPVSRKLKHFRCSNIGT